MGCFKSITVNVREYRKRSVGGWKTDSILLAEI
jgi:hypothetical protein